MIPVGRKGRDFFRRREIEFVEEYIGLTGSGQVVHADAMAIAERIIKTFTEDASVDKVFLVFTQFKTVMTQEVKIEQLLPIPKIEAEDAGDKDAPQAEYIYEQPAA